MVGCQIAEPPEAERHKVRVYRVGDDHLSGLWPWRASCTCGMTCAGTTHQAMFDVGYQHAALAAQEPVDLLPLAKTRLAWDLLDHGSMRDWLLRLGLSPASPDMEELEHREAHDRIEKLAPLTGLAETFAAIIADINAEYMSWQREQESGGADTVPAEARDEFTDAAFRMIRAAVFAVLAEFLADGVIAYGPATIQQLMQGQP